MPKLAIVILNYNDYKTTCEYLQRISCYRIIDRIVIVDNCSTDDSFERLQKLSNERIHVIKTTVNGGYAKGNNEGLRFLADEKVECDYVIISNPDIFVEEASIKRLLDVIEISEDCFAVTGEIYTTSDRRIAGFRSKLPTLCNLFVESSVLLRKALWVLFRYGRQYKNDETERSGILFKAESLPGCFFLASYDKFRKVGFFDENTFLYSEEDILFSKAKSFGYQSYVVSDEKIIHAEGTTIKKNITGWKKRERIREESTLVYMKTCLDSPAWITTGYLVWNRFFSIGRYLNMRFRTKYY